MYFTGTSDDCCCPLVEEVFSTLGSRGLRYLTVGSDPPNMPHYRTLVDILVKKNLFSMGVTNACKPGVFDAEIDELRKEIANKLKLALDRNESFQDDTRKTALNLLQAARVLLHASDASTPAASSSSLSDGTLLAASHRSPSSRFPATSFSSPSSSKLIKPSGHFRFLDLLPELQYIVFSTLCHGALSERQVRAVLHNAGERMFITTKASEWKNFLKPFGGRKPTSRNSRQFERGQIDAFNKFLNAEYNKLLKTMGCDGYDC